MTAAARRAPLCARCQALCCRLTVVLQADDVVADHLSTRTDAGLHVMARGADGWCVALDAEHMRCSIYATRPQACRRFTMSGPYCLAVRADHRRDAARGTPPTPF